MIAIQEARACPQASPVSPAKTRDERITHLAAFTGAIAAGQADRFDRIVKASYSAGAAREDLLGAVEVARVLADAPGPLVVQAYAAIHAWRWIEARRLAPRRSLEPRAA
jgi:alkylhydroperoxidase/carboxymuconolactone decarboxylase family protein YurZ